MLPSQQRASPLAQCRRTPLPIRWMIRSAIHVAARQSVTWCTWQLTCNLTFSAHHITTRRYITRHPTLVPTTINSESPPSIPQCDRTSLWLASRHDSCLPLTPLPDDDSKPRLAPLKRKRAMSLPASVPASSSHRSDSPKRRRTDDADNVQPEQSVSQLGSETPLALNKRNTFSSPASRVSSSPKRSSPTRETPIILRSAWPAGVDKEP